MDPAEEELEEEVPREVLERRRRRRIYVLIGIALLLLAFFVPPLINLGRYRHSITTGIEAALGRPVSVGSISLQLLPMPGIALSDFTVAEDPAFGYEPTLHANSVVVMLRLSSLWRRRLEISRISLDEASLNLVKNQAGQWNIDSVLLRASQIHNAPTGQAHAGSRPRFPYIEASDSRINFKEGAVKQPFSLVNAEFSMWQAGGGEWRLRLKAEPVRTDLELQTSDTGEVNVDGSLRRAASLNAMPLNLRVEWSGAQLGQVSRMLAGFDSGWRGSLDATARVKGTPTDLKLRSTVHISNLRRQEFQPVSTLDVKATCTADYLHMEHTLNDVTCFLPVAPGHLLLTGSVQGLRHPDLQLEINHVPARFPMTLLGLVRSNLQSATATGTINGMFQWATASHPRFSGDATATDISVTNSGGTWKLPPLHLVAASAMPEASGIQPGKMAQQRGLVLQPVAVPFGGRRPLTADARITRSGFVLHLDGPAALRRLTARGAAFGLLGQTMAGLGPTGRVELNTTTAGDWLAPLAGGGSGLLTTGSVHVAGAELRPKFLHAPVHVESADLFLGSRQISWQNAEIRLGGMALRGSVEYPRVCAGPTPCPALFTARAPVLRAAEIEAAVTGKRPGFFGRIIADALGSSQAAPWPLLEGTVQARTFELGRLPLHGATAAILIKPHRLTLTSVDAKALGGTVHANGTMTLSNGAAQWKLGFRLTGVRPSAMANVLGERWGSGRLNGDGALMLSGLHSTELESSAIGDFHFTWQDGGLPGAAGSGVPVLRHFDLWTASGSIGGGALALTTGGLSRGARVTPIRGRIGFDRRLDLTVREGRTAVHVGGTLAHPLVSATR